MDISTPKYGVVLPHGSLKFSIQSTVMELESLYSKPHNEEIKQEFIPKETLSEPSIYTEFSISQIVQAERKNRGNQMENSPSCPRRLNVNLKNLPPINNQRIGSGNHSSIPAKFEKSRYIRRVPQFMPPNHRPEIRPNEYSGLPTKPACFDSARALNTKTIPEAPLKSLVQKKDNCKDGSTKEGTCTSEKRAAKSLLFEICTANHWQPPLFECCEEEGPSHAKKYRFKVTVEMKKGASGTILECCGNPRTRKKVAAENAAEGALWYLNHLGYRLKK